MPVSDQYTAGTGHSDASTKGWEAHLDQVTCQGLNSEEPYFHINCLGMWAVRLALSWFNILPYSNVLVATDYNTVVDLGPSRKRQSDCIFLWLISTFPSLSGLYLARWMPLQTICPEWDRCCPQSGPSIVHHVFNQWGHPSGHFFVILFNYKCLNLCHQPRCQGSQHRYPDDILVGHVRLYLSYLPKHDPGPKEIWPDSESCTWS